MDRHLGCIEVEFVAPTLKIDWRQGRQVSLACLACVRSGRSAIFSRLR